MRIWSLHPQYLDSKGLVALWREALLAKHVLQGKTKGYKNHPQLIRFKQADKPVDAIDQYLSVVYQESCKRGYCFDKRKINWNFKPSTLPIKRGQIRYEVSHLLEKLRKRDPEKYIELKKIRRFRVHSMLRIVDGGIESWEAKK